MSRRHLINSFDVFFIKGFTVVQIDDAQQICNGFLLLILTHCFSCSGVPPDTFLFIVIYSKPHPWQHYSQTSKHLKRFFHLKIEQFCFSYLSNSGPF